MNAIQQSATLNTSRRVRVGKGVIFATIVAVAAAVGLAAANSTSPTTPAAPPEEAALAVSRGQAAAMIERMLTALNTGDHAMYTADLDDAMKAMVTSSTFDAFRASVQDRAGRSLSVNRIDLVPAKTAGYVKWVATATFEKGEVTFAIVLPRDGTKVAGVSFDPK